MLWIWLACQSEVVESINTSIGNNVSEGCGIAQSTIDSQQVFSTFEGDRGYYLVVPDTYDQDTPSRLIVGFSGTNWVGEQIRPYLGLEDYSQPNDIFVYLDPLGRDFEGWGNVGGWVLGPHAFPANGMEDLDFTEQVIEKLSAEYCIDLDHVYATGHSWGGDMTQVVSCFLGDRFRASVPVAANRPYWFESPNGSSECTGQTAVWTMFGINDDHFTNQSYSGEYGEECRDFWLEQNECDGVNVFEDLHLGTDLECVEYTGCNSVTRFCLYSAEYGHQIPSDYYAEETMRFIHSFD